MHTVRRIRADEWEQARMLRLAALADPTAAAAFTDTLDEALTRPAELWQSRARAAAEGPHAQFIAEGADGEWLGTLTVLVYEAGDEDYVGQPVAVRRANVVAVYVRPEARGHGLIDALLDAAKHFALGLGLSELHLEVHGDNSRALGAYERSGFVTVDREAETTSACDTHMVSPLG
jgi:GNAT superfamily N-acetyltransferase